MEIISHRGYWKSDSEKNTTSAFERSFKLGFGTETDIRDYKGELVISHDIAEEDCLTFRDFINLYLNNILGSGTLALNVKADGLQLKAKEVLKEFSISNYFFFDMSIPDMMGYFNNGLKTYTRYSEYETVDQLVDLVDGIWLDGFRKDLIDEDFIKYILSLDKKVCIVSPELHNRELQPTWDKIRSLAVTNSTDNILICTDLPEQARDFFHG
jgi:glycerophosphoryl diester phosphodiesterase